MTAKNFNVNKNFSLQVGNWGNAVDTQVIEVLDSVVSTFYSELDINLISKIPVYISKREDHPLYSNLGAVSIIGINSTDSYWAQYSYQFSHELCHHVIFTDWFETKSKFGWFEEAICEMASLFVLQKMAAGWMNSPPYAGAELFAVNFPAYLSAVIASHNLDSSASLKAWLNINLPALEQDRYMRTHNIFVSLKLLPLFNTIPDLWKTIQYLKLIKVHQEMTFEEFLLSWKEILPEDLKAKCQLIADLFNS